jgi:hypothetical protein
MQLNKLQTAGLQFKSGHPSQSHDINLFRMVIFAYLNPSINILALNIFNIDHFAICFLVTLHKLPVQEFFLHVMVMV